jgi:hypothetical protein
MPYATYGIVCYNSIVNSVRGAPRGSTGLPFVAQAGRANVLGLDDRDTGSMQARCTLVSMEVNDAQWFRYRPDFRH